MEILQRQLPVLPLRGIVLYPTMLVHLDVGRDKSVAAVKKALKDDELIFLLAQKDTETENPKQDDLFEIGTIAKINQIVTLPNGTYRILVEGVQRGKLQNITAKRTFIEANVDIISEESPEDIEIKTLVKMTMEAIHKFNKLTKKVSAESMQLLEDETDVSRLSDSIAGHLPLKLDEKQKLLEVLDVKERFNQILQFMEEQNQIAQLEKKIQLQVRKNMEKMQREYFLREQMKVIQKELGEKDGKATEIEELKKKIQEAKMPEHIEEVLERELSRYEKIPQSSAESAVIKNYIDWLLSLPWHEKTEDTLDIKVAEKILNDDHYGLEKVKDRILDYLAVQQLKQSLRGPILCLVGPPGVGKTSLAKSIARSLNRNFVRISLGGVRDESEIRGHRRTYVGAMPGRIIQGMKKAQTINPVFLLDEIDKLTNDFRGDPAAALLEVLDPEQNKNFSDHYIEETYNLSNVLFIATANDISTIPGPLRDRMEIISLSGYTELEKQQISKDYLLQKQLEEHGLKKGQLQIKDDAILSLIRHFTREAGVRSLERQIGSLCRKAARVILAGDKKRVIITDKNIEEYLGVKRFHFSTSEKEDQVGVATGLAYTTVGGDTLAIEVAVYKGKGKLILTGKLGDVMKESAQTAFSNVRAIAEEWGVESNFYEKYDIHVHVPEGAVPKDGPSAGITIATAILSALSNIPIRKDIGMTGEITLRGKVLPIGGVKEKTLSAYRAGLKKVLLPIENKRDYEEIPEEVRNSLEIVFVTHLEEVLQHALVGVEK